MFCSKCGKPIKDHAQYCGSCGKFIDTGIKYCSVCGFQSPKDGAYCLNCGVKFTRKKGKKYTAGAVTYPVTIDYQKAVYDYLLNNNIDEAKLLEGARAQNDESDFGGYNAESGEGMYPDDVLGMYPYDPYAFFPPPYPFYPPIAPMPYPPLPYGASPYYPPMPMLPPPMPYAPYGGYPPPMPYPPYPYFGQGMPGGGFSYEQRYSVSGNPAFYRDPRTAGSMYIPCRDKALKELQERRAAEAATPRLSGETKKTTKRQEKNYLKQQKKADKEYLKQQKKAGKRK
ncbi:MAG: zinc ribbon domain-containing protein [Clostridiales bacterium]|jgi:hypothetical protein|nr:zinc ribbon domain-containing protein [Clostridiales bacterium]